MSVRYFVGQDNSGHWYLVPEPDRKEWARWLAIPEDDEASWSVPDWALPLHGGVSLLTFADPEVVLPTDTN